MNTLSISLDEGLLHESWRDRTFLVFDFETTSVNPETCNPTQFAGMIVKLKKDGVEIIEEMNQFINPEEDISEEVSKITGIDNELVKNEPTFDLVLPKILSLFEKVDMCVGYNILDYDLPLLNRLCNAHGERFDCPPPIDCFLWYFMKRKKLKGSRQGDAAKQYGVGVMAQIANKNGRLHDALTDVLVCANLLQKMGERDIPCYTVNELLVEQERIFKALEKYKIKNKIGQKAKS